MVYVGYGREFISQVLLERHQFSQKLLFSHNKGLSSTDGKNQNGKNPPAEAGNSFTISSNQVKTLVRYQ